MQPSQKTFSIWALLLLILLPLGLTACGNTQPSTPVTNTTAPTQTPVPPSATPTSTNTPTPTATPTATSTPTITPTPTPAYPVHTGQPLPPLAPISDQWENIKPVAIYSPQKPALLLKGSINDALAVYTSFIEVYRGTEETPRQIFPLQVDPLLEYLSVGDNHLAVASEREIKIYNTNGSVYASLSPEENEVIRAVALSPNAKQVAYSVWQWGKSKEDLTSVVRDTQSGKILAQFPGIVLYYSSSGNLLFVHQKQRLLAYNTQDFTVDFWDLIGEGEIFYTIAPQGERIALLDRVFGWSRYANAGWPILYVYTRDKPERSFDASYWQANDIFSLPTTWNPWNIALSETGRTVAVFYRTGSSTAFATARYIAFDIESGKTLQSGEWSPCPLPWVNDQGETGCQGPSTDKPVLYRTPPIYFQSHDEGWTWAWEKWMPWTQTTTVDKNGQWHYQDDLPRWVAQKHPLYPSAGFLKWAGEGNQFHGYTLKYMQTGAFQLVYDVTLELRNQTVWEHKFSEGAVSTNEPLAGYAIAADDSLFAYATVNTADYLQYRRIPPRTTVYFVTLSQNTTKPQPLTIEGLADKCLTQECQIPLALCNQHYLSIAPPGHPIEIYHLPEGNLIHSIQTPVSVLKLACNQDTLSVLDTTGALRVYGIPLTPSP